MQCVIEIYAIILGAVLYRIRGGWHAIPIQGAQAVRILWSVATGALVWLLVGGPWWLLAASALGAFLGLLLPQGWCINWAQNQNLREALGTAVLGTVRLVLTVAPAAIMGTPGLWWAVAIGPLMTVAYGVGYLLPVPANEAGHRAIQGQLPIPVKPHEKIDAPPPIPAVMPGPINSPTAWAELMWGGLQWGVLVCTATS